jgi:hypothetical protein
MKILAIGTLCAGQRSMLHALKKAGYDVSMDFDEPRPDGVVLEYNGEQLPHIDSTSIFMHIVRNPTYAIPMIRALLRYATISQAAEIWYNRNYQISLKTRRVIRIEDMATCWPIELLRPPAFSKQRAPEVSPLSVSFIINRMSHGEKIIGMAEHYGYSFKLEARGAIRRTSGIIRGL